jgi:hypothetical protein
VLVDDHPTTVPNNTLELSGELSVGDVVEVHTGQRSQWLACEDSGWRHITPPSNLSGQPLNAATVYRRLTEQRTKR